MRIKFFKSKATEEEDVTKIVETLQTFLKALQRLDARRLELEERVVWLEKDRYD